jgi:hypothetical protein
VAFPARVLLFACAIGLFMPVDAHDVLWLVNAVALTATAALIAANVIGARRRLAMPTHALESARPSVR